ncbi:hypothetical protein JCM19000A_30770 [Silvimonas sp. JCM 19000]
MQMDALARFAAALVAKPVAVAPLVEGFYARLYLASATDGPVCVLKVFKQRGHRQAEIDALARLAACSVAPLPGVIGQGSVETHEVLALSWLPGINPDQLTEPTARIRFNADATAALAQWHGQSATYFEDVDGARYATFTDAYAAFVAARQAWLAAHPEKTAAWLAAAVAHAWRRARPLLDALADDTPSLIHDDPHPGNFLADAQTGALTAVLDPGRSRFSHRELDVFHLADGGPQLGLYDAYLASYPLHAGYATRRLLFSVLDDVWHIERADWFDEAWMQRKLGALDAALTAAGR